MMKPRAEKPADPVDHAVLELVERPTRRAGWSASFGDRAAAPPRISTRAAAISAWTASGPGKARCAFRYQ